MNIRCLVVLLHVSRRYLHTCLSSFTTSLRPLSPFSSPSLLFLASVTAAAAYRSIRCFFFWEGTRRVARINVECTRDFESVAISAIVAMERVRVCARSFRPPSPPPLPPSPPLLCYTRLERDFYIEIQTGNNNDGVVVNIQGCNYFKDDRG